MNDTNLKMATWVTNSAETSQLQDYERRHGISLLVSIGYGKIFTWDATQSISAPGLWADIAAKGWPKIVIWEGGLSLLDEFLKIGQKMKIPVLKPISGWNGTSWVFHEILSVQVKTRVWSFPQENEITTHDL